MNSDQKKIDHFNIHKLKKLNKNKENIPDKFWLLIAMSKFKINCN